MSATAPAPSPAPKGARPAAAPAKPTSRLASVKRGVIHEPYRYFLYGPEGVGKSSLAADAPAPIFFDTDRGSGRLDVARYQFRDGDEGHLVLSLAEVYAGVDDLLTSPHEYRTLVIDTVDALEAILWKHVCATAPLGRGGDRPASIEAFGYGKGYQMAVDEWRQLAHRLDSLRLRRGMEIVMLGHSIVKTFKNPVAEDYDRYRPKLHDLALGFLREWCDVLGFTCYEDGAGKLVGDQNGRARGWSTGQRIVRLSHSAAWDAKTRLPMPAEIELLSEGPWSPFAAAVEASRSLSADDVRTMIETELERLGDEFIKSDGKLATAAGVRAAVVAASDTPTLSRYLNGLKQASPKTTTTETQETTP